MGLLLALCLTSGCRQEDPACAQFLRLHQQADASLEDVELVVTFEEGTSVRRVDEVVAESGGTIERQYPVTFVTVGFGDWKTAMKGARFLGSHPDVVSCLPQPVAP